MAAQGFLGAGDLYVARYVSGVQQGWQGPYETSKFEVTTASELKKLTSKGKTTYGQVVESVPIAQPPTFSAEFVRIDKESLTLALLGTQAAISQSAASVTDESVTLKGLGEWVQLAKQRLTSATITVTSSPAGTTYVAGTDYEVNRDLGLIRPLAGGAIAANATVLVDYGHAAYSGYKILGSTDAQIRAAFLFDGINQVDSKPCVVRVWEAVMTSSGAFDFLADEFNKVPLSGDLKTPAGKTSPFEVEFVELS